MWTLADQSPIDDLELPHPVRDPSAVATIAERAGVPEGLVQALVKGEVYRLADTFVMWPWYRAQDEELRPSAERRAAELGAELPPFLDEPYEPAYYLQFTGEAAFARLADEHDLADGLWLDQVPLYDPDLLPDIEFAGGRAPHPVVQVAEQLESLVRDFDWAEEERHFVELRRRLTALVELYFAALNGSPTNGRRTIELSGPSEFWEAPETTIGPVFFTDRGILVQALGELVLVDTGEVVARFEVNGELQFAAKHTALLWENDWRALDLSDGGWLTGELDCEDAFGGSLLPPPASAWGRTDGPDEDVVYTPDAAYAWSDGIQRLSDGVWVSRDDPFYDVRWELERSGPKLDGLSDLDDAVVTELDGVTFRHRTPRAFSFHHRPATAIALHRSGWRGVFDEGLWALEEHACDVGPIYGAAFRADGEAVALLTATHLLEVEWRTTPRVVHATPLATIVAREAV